MRILRNRVYSVQSTNVFQYRMPDRVQDLLLIVSYKIRRQLHMPLKRCPHACDSTHHLLQPDVSYSTDGH